MDALKQYFIPYPISNIIWCLSIVAALNILRHLKKSGIKIYLQWPR